MALRVLLDQRREGARVGDLPLRRAQVVRIGQPVAGGDVARDGMRRAPDAAAVEQDRGDPQQILILFFRVRRGVLLADRRQAQARQLAPRVAALAHARQLDGAQEPGVGEDRPRRERPLDRMVQVAAQLRDQRRDRLGRALAQARERQQRVDRQRVLADRALVGLARQLGLVLLGEDAPLPVVRAPLGVPDLLVRDEAQVLVEPGERLVVMPRAPGAEGQAPQRLVERCRPADSGSGSRPAPWPPARRRRRRSPARRCAAARRRRSCGRGARPRCARSAPPPCRGRPSRRSSAPAWYSALACRSRLPALRADRLGFVEQRRGARPLALLPDRLRAVEARLALEVGVQPGRRQRGDERRLGVGVAVGVEERHAARDPLARGVRARGRRRLARASAP